MSCPHSNRADARIDRCSQCSSAAGLIDVVRVVPTDIAALLGEQLAAMVTPASEHAGPVPTERPDPNTDRPAWLRWRASRAASKKWQAIPPAERSRNARAAYYRTQGHR